MTASQSNTLSEIFRFLSQTLRYPEADWFNDNFLFLYKRFLLDLHWPDQEQFVAHCSPQYLETLQVEYTRLFITATPHVIALPYASVYIDDTLNGPTAMKTDRFYREHGFTLTNNDFPDHIVTELSFAALLADQEGSCETFLEEMFRPWFKHFKKRVLHETTEHYYQTTIHLIDFFTTLDSDD